MKPYQTVVIAECGEPMVAIPLKRFSVVTPHPYEKIGAPYGEFSPYWLRESVLDALLDAQQCLQMIYSGWQLQIFDAYRPVPVQQFMVEHTAQMLAHDQGQDFAQLSSPAQTAILTRVYRFWAPPSLDPATPPPHSTGAAVDITMIDEQGQPVDMGSPIDEVSERSHPDYFQQFSGASHQKIHAHRCQLRKLLTAVGFQQHPQEWWHFSKGDQMWAWLSASTTDEQPVARYGRAEAFMAEKTSP